MPAVWAVLAAATSADACYILCIQAMFCLKLWTPPDKPKLLRQAYVLGAAGVF